MTKNEVIGTIAKERRVERICRNICKSDAPEVQDLTQLVYENLLRRDTAFILRAWSEGWINFYIARVVYNQWCQGHSEFRKLFLQYKRKKAGDIDILKDEQTEKDIWERPRYERYSGADA